MINAIIYLIVFAVVQIFTPLIVHNSYELVTGHAATGTTTLLIADTVVSSVITIGIFLWLRWCEVSRGYVQSRPWGTLTWCAVAAVGAIIPSTFMQELLPHLPNLAEIEFDMILRDRWGYFAIGLFAPVCEELVFRGAILRSLLQWSCPAGKGKPGNHWLAIAISAVFFALAHFNPAQMPHALLVGLLLGWMYYRTDSVVPGVVYHWVNNSVAYVLYNLYPNPDLKLIDLFGSQRHVAAAVVFSLFILLPALYQLSVGLKKAK